MDRRGFLRSAGAGVALSAAFGHEAAGGASPAPARRAAAGPAVRRRSSPDVVVVGAGAFGGWTALELAERGAVVTLVDAYGPGNYRGTSCGDSRQIRAGYGAREPYTRWALRALGEWRRRQEEWGLELMVTCGRLQFAAEATSGMRATKEVLDRNGVENDLLSPEEVARRWPQVSLEGVGVAHWEPGAATIRSAEAMRAVARAFQTKGGELVVARADPGPVRDGRLAHVRLSGAGAPAPTLQAGATVFACGPWLPDVFPDLLGGRITVPRRDVFFFGPPAGDDRFSWPRLPNFSEDGRSVYGFPDLDGKGVKVAPYGGVDPFLPDTDERTVSGHWLKRAREWLALRFPALRDQPLVHSRVCQLENTADEHFLVDRLPGAGDAWIAGGGSGHGFKHGPVIGAYLASRVLGGAGEPEMDALFRIESRGG